MLILRNAILFGAIMYIHNNQIKCFKHRAKTGKTNFKKEKECSP